MSARGRLVLIRAAGLMCACMAASAAWIGEVNGTPLSMGVRITTGLMAFVSFLAWAEVVTPRTGR